MTIKDDDQIASRDDSNVLDEGDAAVIASLSPEQREQIEADQRRYLTAAHAVQAGVKFKIARDPNFATPKDLRIGIDTLKAEQWGLARLLIEKGLLTYPEYVKAIADAMVREHKRFERQLSKETGTKVTLSGLEFR